KERAIFLAHPYPDLAAAVDTVRLVCSARGGEIDRFPIVHKPDRRRRAPLAIEAPSSDVKVALGFQRGLDLAAQAISPFGHAAHTETEGYQQPEHNIHDCSCLSGFIASVPLFP